MKIIMLGAPGAGKGTLSKDLLEKYNYVHISTGDLLRQEVNAGTSLGKEAEGLMKEGIEEIRKTLPTSPEIEYIIKFVENSQRGIIR